ncbi:MAG: tRNA-guanine transglycosylase, partial [Candidatus Heimdallarchaeota archaeon]|nr:tRNA-guanine transglycosylase [Candidatus Heimdallarchaeota archaeon]
SRELLPHNIPFHLFGAGHPMIFPFVVALGSDTFDSAAYILYAKENRYMTNTGTYHLHELYELPCNCEICSNWTPKELLDTDEDTRIRNIALHNLYVSHAELKRIRVSLKDGNLWELLVRRSKAHPSLYKAFKHLANGSDIEYLEYGTPITKQTGLKISGEDSFYRPEYSKGRKRVYTRYTPNNSKVIFLISSGRNNPVELLNLRSELEDLIKSKTDEMDFAFLIPFFGLLPLELIETYPFSQYVFSAVLSEGLLDNLKPEIEKFLEIFQYKEIVLCPLDTWENSEILIKHIKEILIRKNTSFKEKNFREL